MKTQICKECGCIGKPSKALLNQLVSFDDFGNDAGKRETTQSRHGEAKEVDCLKCPNCGHSWIPEKSDREKAIEWWNSIPVFEKGLLIHDTFNPPLNQRIPEEVTGREIEQIWRKETQQELERGIVITREERPQVDFEKLKETFEALYIDMDQILMISDEYIDNFKLFFELLSKSSTFAHKAHKELNKLMK